MTESIGNNTNYTQTDTYKQLSSVKLAAKGDFSYSEQMDLDDDGEITLAEFKEYCDENEVDEADRAKLLQMMMTSRLVQEMTEKRKEQEQKEEAEKEAQKADENKDTQKSDEDNNTDINSIISLNYKQAQDAYISTNTISKQE